MSSCGHSSDRICKRGALLSSLPSFSINAVILGSSTARDYTSHGLIKHFFNFGKASKHFGDILSNFVGNLASTKDITKLPSHLRRACITHGGALTSLYEYIPRMRKSDSE